MNNNLVKKLKSSTAILCLVTGVMLLALNIYGLFIPDRSPHLQSAPESHFRFKNDHPLDYSVTLQRLEELNAIEDQEEFLIAANDLVNKAIGHIEWEDHDPDLYYQTVPIWDNYLLYAMGKLSGLEFYERYHFTDYKRSLNRGIGVCGDHAIVLSEILNKKGIANKIIAVKGHVVVEAAIDSRNWLLDSDFGVVIDESFTEAAKNVSLLKETYGQKGYSDKEIRTLVNAYLSKAQYFDGVSHFISKRYYFEYVSFYMKWLFPLCLLVIPFILSCTQFSSKN